MNKKVSRALDKSIEHWTRLAEGERKPNEGVAPHNCALCGLFNNNKTPFSDECVGCPVFIKTGKKLCAGTPYDEVQVYIDTRKDDSLKHLDTKKFRKLAKKELKFLESLRETDK